MQTRYSSLNQAMHWLTAACMFALIPLAWLMVSVKEGSPIAGALFNWHKTLGAIVLIITAFRIVWRFRDPPPPYPPRVAAWDRFLAHLVYWLFFGLMIFMPITGLLSSTYGGHPIKLFNLIGTPQFLPQDKGLSDFWTALHLWGQWAVYALILVHLGAVMIHVIWGKDGVLGRMLPESSVDPAPAEAPRPAAAPQPATAASAPYARAR